MGDEATTTGRQEAEDVGIDVGLAMCDVFKDLTGEERRTVERACRWLRLPAGHILFRHDDPPDAVYFVAAGLVRAFLPVDGLEVNYAQFGPGEMFGELAAIDGRERSADIVIVTDSVLAACPRPQFLDFLGRYPALALRLLVRLATVIRHSSQRIAEFSALTDVQRVYLELLRLANPDPSGDGRWVVRPVPLHKDMAGWAATTTDVVGRALGHLMKAGLVQRRQGALVIHDRRRLEIMAREVGNRGPAGEPLNP
jgi:CRP-like cAMP-binding protein